MRCIISTSTKGYVYDISNPQLLSEFDYCGECLMSAANSLFLFAVTPAGMEVWSVLGSTGGCLLRSHPFIGLKGISATNKHVVLLSKFKTGENVSLAAYYNKSSSNLGMFNYWLLHSLAILSDIRNIDKIDKEKTKGSVMPLFSGARRNKNAPPEKTIIDSYNLYILNFVELCEIYEDILEKACDAETLEPEKHLKLIKESHSLLQSKYYELLSQGIWRVT